MNDLRSSSIRDAERRYHEARKTSHAALTRQEQAGHRAGNEERVRKMWGWLAQNGHTPCSMKTAADIVTDRFGEHYFTSRQTNADVIRKRTADIVRQPFATVVRIGENADPDGVKRDQFDAVLTDERRPA